MSVFLDTNVLLYSISTEPTEAPKRDRARALLDRDDCVLSVQVLQEFFVQSTRASRRAPLPDAIAVGLIRTWRRFPVRENTLAVFDAALEISERFGFSFWDSSIIAAAHSAGCSDLYSEDLTDRQTVRGVRIRNPFR